MHEGSIFNIRIDFEKSHDAYIYDKSRYRYFLDFFGQYSTLPLGYNHPIFYSKEFREAYSRIANFKVVNGELISDEWDEFYKNFTKHEGMNHYDKFYFCCTGALAVETAIKTAIDYNGKDNPLILGLKESFHGINGYASFITDDFPPIDKKLKGFPTANWCKSLNNPKYVWENGEINIQKTQDRAKQFKHEFEAYIANYNVAALFIEPIQSTYGDNYFPKEWFEEVRMMCDKYDICLIFDEIQTGFGATGKMWYYQHLGIEPDIVCFGKKSQTSGVMVKERFGKIFETLVRLEATWDSDLVDQVRCNYILQAYDQYHILENVRRRGQELLDGLKQIEQVKNARGIGLIVAFDLENHEAQENFAKNAFELGLLFNKTRDTTIRLRPNLNITHLDVQEALKIIKRSVSDE